ncbi:MAG: cytochrome c [Lautropia sp.]
MNMTHISASGRARVAAVALTLAALGASLPAAAADLAAGEKIAQERCAACHGKDGNTPIDPSYAKLAGQHSDYLVHALKAYRSDRRKNAIMGAQAKTLSTDDIYNLAAWFSRQPGDLRVRK